MHIEIDKSKCIGSLPCTKVAPAVFRLGDDGKAYVIDPKAATDEEILLAAKSCPTKAISLKDDVGNIIFPSSD